MIPNGLRVWFVVHFVVDLLVALPLFFAPHWTLELVGWYGYNIDPFATRIVAAALFGIGIESLLGRNASIETFRAMLNLKVIWSTSAIIGLVWSMLSADNEPPRFVWLAILGFIPFSGAWIFYRWRLRTN